MSRNNFKINAFFVAFKQMFKKFSFPDKKVIKDVLNNKPNLKINELLNDLSLDSRIILGIGKILNFK